MVDYIRWFKDISKDDVSIAGGKGANLGEMFRAGFPVPPGFIVTAQTFKAFIEETGIKEKIFSILREIDVNDTDKLQESAKKIQKIVTSTEIPEKISREIKANYSILGVDGHGKAEELVKEKEEFTAVRSSATAEDLPEASFAGQQASFLNVRGKENLINAVRACWASLYTARAIYYREKNNFPHENVLIAVAVQKMVNSSKSGVMFTINPSTNIGDEIVIEAVYGLGEAIVSGSVNPDLYIIDKKDLSIKKHEIKKQEWGYFRDEEGKTEKRVIDKEVQERQVVDDHTIRDIALYGRKIEEYYGKPQDIEWAIEGDKVYIVQSRAVTTFKPSAAEEKKEDEGEEKILVKGETASAGVASGKVKLVMDISHLDKIEKGDILVTVMTTPDMVPAMQKASAIVTDEGGLTCHAAIVSREMGIPCIVGSETATKILKEGEVVTVHATRGIVYEGKIKFEKTAPQKEEAASGESAPTERQICAEPITATEIKVIMDIPEMAERAASTGADGVGLVRLEIMIANGGIHPAQYIRDGNEKDYINLLYEGIKKIAYAFKGKTVWVRNSDMRTDEYKNLKGADQEPKETDPMIGWHGIRRLLDEDKILKAEFTAIKKLHDEGYNNVGVMLPFVINRKEAARAKDIMRSAGLIPGRDVDFGVMIETPASCWVIEDICKEGIDFISFGTNDLTQLTLGIDRNNSRIQKLFDEMHPAVLGEMAKVIKTCKRYGVKTSICGQAGSRPEMAEFLVHQGIDSISANVDAVQEIRKTVARTEKKVLLDTDRDQIV